MSKMVGLAWPCVALLVAGCGGSSEPGADEANLDVKGNLDVQVVSAKSSKVSLVGLGLDPGKCDFVDKQPYESQQFTHTAKGDCTDAVSKWVHLPLLNKFIDPVVWIREGNSGTYAVMRHWCSGGEVVVAVKAAAWDSETLLGLGFFADEPVLDVPDAERRLFYSKDDPRLVRTGDATLRGGEKAYLYKFEIAGPCDVNGTGHNPTHAIAFKPYVTYEGGYERWEAVSGDHQLSYGQAWSRSDDVLQ